MILTYNDKEIQQRELDNYVNITQMAKANNVFVKDFIRSNLAKEYLKALQESIGAKNALLTIQGFGSDKTTWAHPLVAIAFGQWISPQFHVWCNIHIKTLLETGKTEIDSSDKKNKIKELENTISLTERVVNLKEQIPSVLQQVLFDQIADVCIGQQNLLSGQALKMGVAQRAEELGYQVTIKNRSLLGKFIAKQFTPNKEKRLCNGELRLVNLYTVNDDLDGAIHCFFKAYNEKNK